MGCLACKLLIAQMGETLCIPHTLDRSRIPVGINRIPLLEKVANLTFGDPDKDRLFITASTSLYAIPLNTRGIQRP
jgi:sugar lactone lactonase YvrE